MNIPLLATKFHIPPLRTSSVTRTRLLDQLTGGLDEHRKLTLVSSPAGYGKTTLITEWLYALKSSNWRVIWLSLEDADNDFDRFLRYLISAYEQVDSSISEKIQPWLTLQQLPSVNLLLDELINSLTALEFPILLTLDDYHVITNPQIHAVMEYYLDHQPASLHIAITTREDPPLPLARLRARRQMTEIRARDLRFLQNEARQFFNDSVKLSLDNETLHILNERTEGWAVGLQLAGLALQNLSDPERFVETFSGSHRYVLDYLAGEVIRQQTEEIRTFLTQTSILDRFNADSCCALTGREDAQTVITYLEQANLFIVPLDDERIWFRYHHLFSDYLRTLLSRSEQIELQKKASAWYEANQMMVDAVRHALASKDSDYAAEVVSRTLTNATTWSGGNITLLSSWLDALPPQSLQSRPSLSLNASRILFLSGRYDLAETYLTLAEKNLKSLPSTVDVEQMLALASLYRGSMSSVRGDFEQAIQQTVSALARLPRENHLAHARGYFNLGLAYENAGQTGLAVKNYLQSSQEAKSAGVLFLAINAMCAAAQVQIKQGRLNLAAQTCQDAIQIAEGKHLPPLGLAWTILGGIALERNNLASAEKLLMDGIALSRQGGLTEDIILGLSFLARLRVYQGNPTSAFAVVQEVKDMTHAFGMQGMDILAGAYLARLQLYLGQKKAAAQWAAEVLPDHTAAAHEFVAMTLARILLDTGELGTVPTLLHPLLEKATAEGRMQTCIEVMLLLGLYHSAKQDTPSALGWLEKCLQLAGPEGYARIFLDEGKPLLDLLPKVRNSAPELVDSLLSMSRSENGSRSTSFGQLPEPLSEQEIRVLKLIVAGKSNAEVAAELVISVGTAKWHVHNVLQKLGVGSRPQAIARARELGL